ncbi:MAG: 1,2-phenylacetyl-CoA epoxidase subunit PaaB [Halobacteriaceae archaeon]
MIWEVFRQEEAGDYHVHCGNVHAPDAEMAKMFAQIQHGRRKPTNSLWVVPKQEVQEVDTDDAHFGGTTDKSYRWMMSYNVDVDFADEIRESEEEQAEASQSKGQN